MAVWDEDKIQWVTAAAVTDAPSGGTGAAAGGWDTAGNRDTAIAAVNGMLAVLRSRGLTTATDAPVGGTGAIAGGWDTAGNRDTGRAAINGALAAMREKGWISSSAGSVSAGGFFDTNKIQWCSAAAVTDAPAGGTGAAGGCYDTAGNRNTFISRINTILSVSRSRGLVALD